VKSARRGCSKVPGLAVNQTREMVINGGDIFDDRLQRLTKRHFACPEGHPANSDRDDFRY